jgi:hypothetical protein
MGEPPLEIVAYSSGPSFPFHLKQNTDGLEQAIRNWPAAHRILFGDDDFNELAEELKAILPYTDNLARGLRGNPRQIKRFLNIIAVRRKLAKENGQEIEPDLLVTPVSRKENAQNSQYFVRNPHSVPGGRSKRSILFI